MPKNVKCSQCKYFNPPYLTEKSVDKSMICFCQADLTIRLKGNTTNKDRECLFYRSRTETAWQEVGRNIIRLMLNFIKDIIGIFKK